MIMNQYTRNLLSIIVLFVWSTCLYSQEWKDVDGKKIRFTKSGLKYYVDKKPKKKTSPEATVYFHFIWYGENNKQIKMSTYKDYGIQECQIKNSNYVPGFTEALQMLKKGEKGYFIIPPELAFGTEGIDGESTLYYFIEIIEIKQ
jgi:FKBP-type peptidyl-prolyl cis-trans isomerase FkpA